ncbi:DUF4439 domain-containing protein [Arthrobacter sp. NPDC092385]|uniref:DUF4439 domain-containing protein n=1 Tax=Arthrobacter sp. NPDC092385 TaxID=3363943 RepID=UPI00381CB5E9
MASSGTVMMRGRAGGQQVRGGRAASAAARVVRWSAALIGLFLVVLLVAGIGTGLRTPEPEAPAYSASEQAQLDAEGRFRTLAADARAAAAADPARAERLAAVAADLDVQAAAVALPRSPASADATDAGMTPDAGSSTASAPGGPADPPDSGDPTASPVDGARVLALLRDSSLRSLRDAVGAEPGAARVLAASGVNQWRHAVLLGQVLGAETDLPSADALPPADLAAGTGLFGEPAAVLPSQPAAGGVGEVGARVGAPDECAGTPLGPDADRQALLNAQAAEDRARYGYEVAAALLPDAEGALARSAAHRAAGVAAARLLVRLCAEPGPAPAGFSIAPAFRADPAGALRELEQDHAALYAGLVPTVGPEVRPWAIASYNAAAQRSLDDGTPLEALPALQAGVAGTADVAPASAATGGPDAPAPTEQPDE